MGENESKEGFSSELYEKVKKFEELKTYFC